MPARDVMPFAFLGFSCIAALTWFFSYRPRLFIRIFVPAEELRKAARGILHPDFGRAMRIMASMQFGVATIFGVVALCLRFAN